MRHMASELEPPLVAAAALGDEDAFRQLFEPLAPEILVFCYRMLSSFHDAEDAVQETSLKAWRGLETSTSAQRFARGCTVSLPIPAWTCSRGASGGSCHRTCGRR